MGNEQATVGGRNVKFISNQVHQYLGNIQVYKTANHPRQIASVTGQQGQNFDIIDHTSLRHPNLINLLTYDSDLQELVGVQSNEARFYFDLYHTTLRDVINQRQAEGQRFFVYEVQRILTDLLSFISHLETSRPDVAHWNISPETIFWDENEKRLKVYDNEIIQGQFSSFYRHFNARRALRHNDNKKYQPTAYATPEIAQALYNTSRYDHLGEVDISNRDKAILLKNKQKGDLYQLGLTLLELITYKSSLDLYNTETFTIDTQEIEKRIQYAGTLVGSDFEPILRRALTTDVNERPTASQIWSTGYVQSILANNEQIDLLHPDPQHRVLLQHFQQPVINVSRVAFASPIKSQVLQNFPASVQASRVLQQSQVKPAQTVSAFSVQQQQQPQFLKVSQVVQPVQYLQQVVPVQQLTTSSLLLQPSRVVYSQVPIQTSQIGRLQNLDSRVNQVIGQQYKQ